MGQTMPDKTILILGGGIGGHVAANRLRRLLGKQHRIVLVDRERTFTFSPSWLWMIVGAQAGFASGDFYATPEPVVKLQRPGHHWHWGKILFERWWLSQWF